MRELDEGEKQRWSPCLNACPCLSCLTMCVCLYVCASETERERNHQAILSRNMLNISVDHHQWSVGINEPLEAAWHFWCLFLLQGMRNTTLDAPHARAQTHTHSYIDAYTGQQCRNTKKIHRLMFYRCAHIKIEIHTELHGNRPCVNEKHFHIKNGFSFENIGWTFVKKKNDSMGSF